MLIEQIYGQMKIQIQRLLRTIVFDKHPNTQFVFFSFLCLINIFGCKGPQFQLSKNQVEIIDTTNFKTFAWVKPQFKGEHDIKRNEIKQMKKQFKDEFVRNGFKYDKKTASLLLQFSIKGSKVSKIEFNKNLETDKWNNDTITYIESELKLHYIEKNKNEIIKIADLPIFERRKDKIYYINSLLSETLKNKSA